MTDLDTTTFNTPNGYVTTDFDAIPTNNSICGCRAIALQLDGKIVMTGYYYDATTSLQKVAVCRYNSNGTLDLPFGGSGTGKIVIPIATNNTNADKITLQSDGKIVICGIVAISAALNIFVMRLTTAGILDTSTFGVPLGYTITTPAQFTSVYGPALTFDNCEANSVTMQTYLGNEYIVIGGTARVVATSSQYYALARYNTTTGTLDTTFGSSGLVVQSFNPPTISGQYGYAIYADSTKILLAGNKFIGSYLRMTVVQFSGNGILDAGFGTGSGFTNISNFFPQSQDQATGIVIQSDGKIVLGGTSINANPPSQRCFALARLLPSGLIDTTYGTSGSGKVLTDLSPAYNLEGNTMGIQPDDKIILGGLWDILGTSPASFALARYNTTGTLDTTFGLSGTGFILEDIDATAGYVETGYSLAIQPDGKILMGGVLNENIVESGPQRFILARYFGFPPFPPPPTPIVPICFPAGTPVTTDQGEINIELIDPDVHTIFNKKIIAITQTIMLENNIVCFEKNSLGYNIPNKKTYISKYHCINYNHKLIEAYKFVGRLRGVYYEKYNGELLYNILMEKHYIIKINNLKVETLNPKNFVAHLYTNHYTDEEKINIILKMNEETIKNANTISNTTSLRNIQFTRKSYQQNRLNNNYFVTKLHNRTIRKFPLFQNEKNNSNTLKYKPFIKKTNYIGKTHKRFNR